MNGSEVKNWSLRFWWTVKYIVIDLKKTKRQYWKGRHSNIPLCCVLFWLMFWRNLGIVHHINRKTGNPVYDSKVNTFLLKNVWKKARDFWGIEKYESEYIQCPICLLTGRFEELHHCTSSCIDVKGSCYIPYRKDLRCSKISPYESQKQIST